MASLMEELLDVLGKEEKQYQELITLATEKTDAVVQGNIETSYGCYDERAGCCERAS